MIKLLDETFENEIKEILKDFLGDEYEAQNDIFIEPCPKCKNEKHIDRVRVFTIQDFSRRVLAVHCSQCQSTFILCQILIEDSDNGEH